MVDPLEELERLVALPGVRVIRIEGPPASGKSTLIRLLQDRRVRTKHMCASDMQHTRFDGNTIGICARGVTFGEVEPNLAAVVADYDLERHKHLRLESISDAVWVKVVVAWKHLWTPNTQMVCGLKVILLGHAFDSKPDIVMPGGGWSRQIHPKLPQISRDWFYQVFLLLLLKGLPTEMVELVLTRLYGWQIDLYETYAMRLGKRTLKVDLTHTLCPPRGAA